MPEPVGDHALHQALSALADGEASAAELSHVLEAWPQQPGLQRQWLSYQLLGDTLRSAELARQRQPTEALLARLRPQLAAAPRVLAPHALRRSVALRRWLAPAAVAAGFVTLVAGLHGLSLLMEEARPSRALLASAPASLPAGPQILPGGSGLSFAQGAAPAPTVAGGARGLWPGEPAPEPVLQALPAGRAPE